jgi:hypothetical protein
MCRSESSVGMRCSFRFAIVRRRQWRLQSTRSPYIWTALAAWLRIAHRASKRMLCQSRTVKGCAFGKGLSTHDDDATRRLLPGDNELRAELRATKRAVPGIRFYNQGLYTQAAKHQHRSEIIADVPGARMPRYSTDPRISANKLSGS